MKGSTKHESVKIRKKTPKKHQIGRPHYGYCSEHAFFFFKNVLLTQRTVAHRVVQCRMRDNDVFCAVSLSGTMWSAMLVLLETTPLATM